MPLTDELTGRLMRIHAALSKMGKRYGEPGSRDVDVARWNADLHEAIAAVGDVLADQPLGQLHRATIAAAPVAVPMWQQMGAESPEQWEQFKAWQRQEGGQG